MSLTLPVLEVQNHLPVALVVDIPWKGRGMLETLMLCLSYSPGRTSNRKMRREIKSYCVRSDSRERGENSQNADRLGKGYDLGSLQQLSVSLDDAVRAL
jgi:hypothetical protein